MPLWERTLPLTRWRDGTGTIGSVPKLRGGLMLLLVAVATGCSSASEVTVANPCPTAVEVRLFDNPGTVSADGLAGEKTIPPGRAIPVGEVITDPGDYDYAVAVGEDVLRFTTKDLERNDHVVVLPSTWCDDPPQ